MSTVLLIRIISTKPSLSCPHDKRIHAKDNTKVILVDCNTLTPICCGDKIVMETSDPELGPLPDFAILEFQWLLQRLTAMSGGPELDEEPSDDDYHDYQYGSSETDE